MTISTAQLTEHKKELTSNSRCDIINQEICAIGAKIQVGKEEVRANYTYIISAVVIIGCSC